MRKKPKRRTIRQPRRCIFCEGGAVRGNPMSGEHIWPEWMHGYLPTIPNPTNWTTYSASSHPDEVRTVRKKPQMGAPFTKTVKFVCKRCNETWMGDIEEEAKPVLIPVITGKNAVLNETDQRTVATWLALKALVLEHDKNSTPVATREMLGAFMIHQEIPSGMKIWIGSHSIFEWAAGHWMRGMIVSRDNFKPRSKLRKNVHTFALGAGHLFALVTFLTTDVFSIDMENKFTPQLWPIRTSEIKWPSRPLSPRRIADLANILDGFETSPGVVWGTLAD